MSLPFKFQEERSVHAEFARLLATEGKFVNILGTEAYLVEVKKTPLPGPANIYKLTALYKSTDRRSTIEMIGLGDDDWFEYQYQPFDCR